MRKLDAGAVNDLAGPGFGRRIFHAVGALLRDGLRDAVAVERAEHRFENVAGVDAARAVDLGILLVDAVAGDAGDAFAGDLGAFPKGEIARLAHARADAGVAAHAEIVDGAGSEVVDFLLELVEDGRDGGVGVVGGTPLVVDLFVARGTFAGARVTGLREHQHVRVDAVGGFRFCREQHLGGFGDGLRRGGRVAAEQVVIAARGRFGGRGFCSGREQIVIGRRRRLGGGRRRRRGGRRVAMQAQSEEKEQSESAREGRESQFQGEPLLAGVRE